MTKEELDPGKVLVIHDFLSGEECAALIRRSEGLSYEEANRGHVLESYISSGCPFLGLLWSRVIRDPIRFRPMPTRF